MLDRSQTLPPWSNYKLRGWKLPLFCVTRLFKALSIAKGIFVSE
jgi:hypothetical protein